MSKIPISKLKEIIIDEYRKLTEGSDGKWVVWVGQGSSKNRKLVKVGKSRRAALVI